MDFLWRPPIHILCQEQNPNGIAVICWAVGATKKTSKVIAQCIYKPRNMTNKAITRLFWSKMVFMSSYNALHNVAPILTGTSKMLLAHKSPPPTWLRFTSVCLPPSSTTCSSWNRAQRHIVTKLAQQNYLTIILPPESSGVTCQWLPILQNLFDISPLSTIQNQHQACTCSFW